MNSHHDLVVEHERWDSRLGRLWKVLIAASFLLVLVTTGFVVYTLNEVRDLAETNAKLNARMVECTTPGYRCYDEGQRRTGRVVLDLNAVTKAAVICADQPGTITRTEMESCLHEQLGK